MVHVFAPSLLQAVRYAHSVGLSNGQFRALSAAMHESKYVTSVDYDKDDMVVFVNIRWDSALYQTVRQRAASFHVDVFEVTNA